MNSLSDRPSDMALQRSSATHDDVDFYREGMCHVFAIALHRRFGWYLHVVLDQDEHYWEDPADADNFIPTTAHVYAVDEELNAWDVRGVRPLSEVKKELDGLVSEYDSDEIRSERDLKLYVGCWAEEGEEPIDRPLSEYSDADVAEADAVAQRVLGHLPQFVHQPGVGPSRN